MKYPIILLAIVIAFAGCSKNKYVSTVTGRILNAKDSVTTMANTSFVMYFANHYNYNQYATQSKAFTTDNNGNFLLEFNFTNATGNSAGIYWPDEYQNNNYHPLYSVNRTGDHTDIGTIYIKPHQ